MALEVQKLYTAKSVIWKPFIDMPDLQKIQEEIERIHERNRRVESDKSWETSWFRILFVAVIIYTVAGIFMMIVKIVNPWINAFVPALGYVLSEQSLPFVKKWWIRRVHKK